MIRFFSISRIRPVGSWAFPQVFRRYTEAMNRDLREAPLDINSDNDKIKPGKHSLMSATFVQTHNAIGAGILLFPYAFWAFGGPVQAVAAQLVSYYCTTTICGHCWWSLTSFKRKL